MTTNRLLVLISIKTLRPEVEDYWLSIPPVLQTIDSLKRFVIMTESIGGSADDIGLYLNNGLLRDNTPIDCLRDRDRIRIRVKKGTKRRISSSADNPSENKKCKCSVNECITSDEFDAESVNNRSAIKSTAKVDIKCESDTKISPKSMVTESKDNTKSVQEVTGHESHGSTAGGQHSLFHREPQSFHEFIWRDLKELTNVDTCYDQLMASEWSSPQHSSTASRVTNCYEEVVTQSGIKCETNDQSLNASESVANGSVTVYRCDWPKCAYTTTAGQLELIRHKCGHCIDGQYFCAITGCGKKFPRHSRRTKHHLSVHPNEFPDVPWIQCTHDGCLFAAKSHHNMNSHLKCHSSVN